jgi:hypothetical protein
MREPSSCSRPDPPLGWRQPAGAFRHGWVAPNGRCSAQALPGTVVDVRLAGMGPMRVMMGR